MNYDESVEIFEKLFTNQLSPSDAKNLLVDLYERGESSQEIAAAASVMRKYSIALDIDKSLRSELIDIVGTGGDKSNSFNISSTVALLLSSMGSMVAKHGNRSITSNSGSADMLEALGINLNLDPQKQVQMLQECGFTFMFAINHHPAMKYIMPIRKSLDHRTIFNILGPLTSPARAKKYLLGVFAPTYLERLVDALKLLDTTKAVVVSSRDGMDEISISDITYARILENGESREFIIDPQEYGMKLYSKEEILGGSATQNAEITMDIFKSRANDAKRDIVLLNSAMALVADKKARDIQDGIEMAREAIEKGLAKDHLAKIIKVSNTL